MKTGDITQAELIIALQLACERIPDYGQSFEDAADHETWMRRFMGQAAGRCLNWGSKASGTLGPCGECAWCVEREWIDKPREYLHDSDCAVHNGPAMPRGACDCRLKANTAVCGPKPSAGLGTQDGLVGGTIGEQP